MRYNWQYENWANFEYDSSIIDQIVIRFALETGELKGMIDTLPEDIKQETIIQFMIDEAIKTSEIEGEFYSRQDVMSSIKNKIGIHSSITHIKDKNVRGISELMVDVRDNFKTELTEDLIKEWHKILFENSTSISAGNYRIGEEPMVIVSGAYGREKIHYQAPPSDLIPTEMQEFVNWYNEFKVEPIDIKNALIKTSIAHLYFESIHPFEDGNGRIGRAIAEKCLAESFNRPLIMSLSSTIEKDKKKYYEALKDAQRTLEITDWILYFSTTILDAQIQAKKITNFTLNKTKFLDQTKQLLNERQLKVVIKMLDQGAEGFEGGMSAKKYMSITKTSKATATRDLQDLVEKSVLMTEGAGRSVRYELNM
ncbi:Fic family protein [Empedobacter brevis]|uniref:Fic family protein n=1 Tax=Empedobacter brevis TaxID=247 RepID=UPI00333F2B72